LSLFHPSPRPSFPKLFCFKKEIKVLKTKKNENSRNVVSPGVGKGTRHVPALLKDYHTTAAELETHDLLKVRSRRRLAQSEGLCCVYGWGVRTYPERVSFGECFVCPAHGMDGLVKNVGSSAESIRMQANVMG
jgi:hypothetical protein